MANESVDGSPVRLSDNFLGTKGQLKMAKKTKTRVTTQVAELRYREALLHLAETVRELQKGQTLNERIEDVALFSTLLFLDTLKRKPKPLEFAEFVREVLFTHCYKDKKQLNAFLHELDKEIKHLKRMKVFG